ncbi:MAG: glycosyltransferase family 2 protein [Fervidobacterium sp.]|nr:glycosyltransferase family 2 protein [Fervidobacterium sp.]
MIFEVKSNKISKSPTVSIIIPAYNLERYIGKAINSVFEELTSSSDLELIIVNDGSKDKTEEKILEVLKGNKINWTLISQSNSGVSAARNIGIQYARGRYIRFLDGDDEFVSGSVQKLLSFAEHYNADFVFGKFVMKTAKGKTIMTSDDLSKLTRGLKNKKDIIIDFLNYKPFIHLGNILFCKETLVRHNVRFTQGVKISEDFEFIAKLMYNSNRIVFLDEYVYQWLYRKTSTTKTKSLAMFHHVGVMKRLIKYFFSKGESDIAKKIQNEALALAYGQVIGILAYNRLDYRVWRMLANNKEIKKYVSKIKLDRERSRFHSKMHIAKNVYHLSPTLLYVIMRMARKYHDVWAR